MDIDGQENQFEGENHVPIEEMEKLKELTFWGTILDNDDDQDGKPKAIKESRQDTDHHLDLRICDLCGKTFSGGKALGGHRRSHFQTKKAVGFSKNIKKRDVAGADLRMDYEMINGNRCRICNKDFPSMQSLFGHMRSHPERSWRGIQPPILPSRRNSISSSSTSDSVDDDHNITSTDKRMAPNVDLLKSLSNWSQTERRGRGNIGSAWAAEIIMSFSREKDSPIPKHSVSCMDQRVDPSAVVVLEERRMKKLKTVSCTDQRVDPSAVVEEQRMTNLKIHGSGTSGRKEDEEKKIAEGGMPDKPSKDRYQIGQKKMNKKKILKCWEETLMRNSDMEEDVDHDLIDRTQKAVPYSCYECSDCGKSFPTFQALGGHRSSHNKDKMQKSNASLHEAAPARDQEKTSANINHRSWPYRTGGVAETPLNKGASPAEAKSTQSAAKIASPKEASTSTDQSGVRRLTMGFDLNKPHFMEDLEDV
ncbi:hypothetical protein F2P56_033162 [Juglans regia]|uniref:Zinc finger protein ZAT4-like n=2 Tax=Juglans regia TaxID=51240 RepID=A0A2I4FMY1_JUGRE|nr:zinc finger protein ZAT4-like [Juglans regia]KAF5447623.1 hypothetical protein F2P56_033162 [Juglans regia]